MKYCKNEREIMAEHIMAHHKEFGNPKNIAGVMREYKSGELHSGSKTGKVVTNPKQAIAIAINEQKKLNKQ